MLKNIKIGTKLLGGFLTVAFITLIVGFMGWNGADNMGQGAAEIADVRLPSIDSLRIIKKELESLRVAQRTLLNPLLNDVDHKRQFENFDKAREKYQKAWAVYEPLPQTKEEAEYWKQFAQAIDDWKKENNIFMDAAKEVAATGILNPIGLSMYLQQFRADHYKLAKAALELIDNDEPFEGGEDHTACNFGKWIASYKKDNKEINSLIAEMKPFHAAFHNNIKEVKALMAQHDKGAARILYHSELDANMSRTFGLFQKLQEKADAIRDMYTVMNNQAMTACLKKQRLCLDLLDKIIAINEDVARDTTTSVHRETSKTKTIAIAGMIIGTLLAAIIGLVLTRMITVPLSSGVSLANAVSEGDVSQTVAIDQNDEIGILAKAMNKMVTNLKEMVIAAERIADGDLSVAVTPMSEKDALGKALKTMVEKLSNIMSEINVAAGNVAAGSEQMSSTSQAMSQGATEQASSLEEITSSMSEIGSQTKQNAENAGQANNLAAEARGFAEKGNRQMSDMVDAMKEINASSQNISKIIKVIDEIAFQTNLLALNAAVEAARAGKHGKGFAVVAEEVRNLAARSAKAARETAEMIEGSVKKAEGGTEIAQLTAGALEEIVTSVTKATDLVAEIAAASNEQAQGVSQITIGLGQVDQVTQQNTAHAEECASAAEELASQAQLLQQLISTFRLSDEKIGRRPAGQRILKKEGMAIAAKGAAPTGKSGAPWGGSKITAPADGAEPVINLDDREFGKY